MAYTYTDNLRITKIATGSDAGTWGDRTNENWDRIDAFSGGYTEITLSGSTHTIDTDDGALVGTDGADGWNKILRFIGSPGEPVTVTIDPDLSAKWYFVTNACGDSITFEQTAGTDTVILEDGYSTSIYCTGGSTKNVIRASDIIGATTDATNVFSGYGVASSRTGIANSVIIGRDAGAALTTQDNNVIIGYEAAKTIGATSADGDNVIIGYRAGMDADGTGGSVFIGSTAGDNVGLDNNVAIGNSAMKGIAGSSDVGVAVGSVAIGAEAMENAGKGSTTNAAEYNVAIGYQSLEGSGTELTGNYNAAVGYRSGQAIQTGFGNSLVGRESGKALTTGSDNVFLGLQAGSVVTTGVDNIAIGQNTGPATNSGTGNILIGNTITPSGNNKLIIDYQGFSTASTDAFIYGEMDNDLLKVNSNSTTDVVIFNNTHASFTETMLRLTTTKAANSDFDFVKCGADSVNQFRVSGDGVVYAINTTVQSAADYADMFEWSDGNSEAEDRIGLSVVLDDGGVLPATVRDDPDDIVGVVSGTACMIGNSAWSHWEKKFLKDDFGRVVMETVDEKVTPILNPEYDEAREYHARMARSEWAVIGLTGRIHLRKGSPAHPSWKKIRDVSAVSEEWLVR